MQTAERGSQQQDRTCLVRDAERDRDDVYEREDAKSKLE